MGVNQVGVVAWVKCCCEEGRTADPSASPDFLSRVAASVGCVWFSLKRTTSGVAGESSAAGNPGTLGMTKGGVGFQSASVARIPGLKRETWGTLRLLPSIGLGTTKGQAPRWPRPKPMT
jgi:hypothetical protein